jgi:hypothetical protein
VQAHVRLAGARRGGGIELANVIADLVGPQLRDLGAAADARAETVAGQRAAHAAGDHEVERLDEALRNIPRTLPGVRLD